MVRGVAIVVLVGTVAVANWATSTFGLVPAGFGLVVTAGTYAAAVALIARDVLHDTGGLRWVLAAIAVGIALSFALGNGRVAIASAVAFGLSEVADTAVYAPLRRRSWRGAVIASQAVGALVDTLLFLSIAFGAAALTAQAIGGQMLVKVLWVAVPVAVIGGEVRRRAVSVRQESARQAAAEHAAQ